MKRNAIANFVDSFHDGEVPAGSCKWTGLYGVDDPGPFGINFKCPCGCGAIHGAGFDNRPADWVAKNSSPLWHWDGNKEKPTLSPSLGLHVTPGHNVVGPDGNYHWHGYLRAGIFEEC